MQISLKFIRGINYAKSTTCIKFQLLVTFSSLFTGSSILPVFALSVLYLCRTLYYHQEWDQRYHHHRFFRFYFNSIGTHRQTHWKPFIPAISHTFFTITFILSTTSKNTITQSESVNVSFVTPTLFHFFLLHLLSASSTAFSDSGKKSRVSYFCVSPSVGRFFSNKATRRS